MGKYSIGARVRNGGDEGTITAKRKGERRVRFDWYAPDAEGGWWGKDELEPVVSATVTVGVSAADGEPWRMADSPFIYAEKVVNELNDGDRVVYTGKSELISSPRLVGKKGTVTGFRGEYVGVAIDGDPDGWFVHIDNIEKAPAEPKFAVGDKVSVTGTITSLDDYYDNPVATIVHDGGCFYAPHSALTAV